MNIALCITVLNEENSIGPLLASIFRGTKKPNEIVIVDGGSTDATASVISSFQLPFATKKIKLKFIKTKHLGIASGRNLAIENSKSNIIVQTDAGCVVNKDWLEKITQPFKNKKVDIVAGFYEMRSKTPLQAAFNLFHGTPPQRFNKNSFLPSARSVAFRKAVWHKIGGYNEKLKNTGEDSLFFSKAVKNNFKIERVGQARVIWVETENMSLKKFMTKLFNYAKGDIDTKIWWHPTKHLASHNIKVVLVFIRYGIGLILLSTYFISNSIPLLVIFSILFTAYLLYSVYKWRDVPGSAQTMLWLPIVQISADLAVMAGFVSGILMLNGPVKRNTKRH